MKLIVGLGNPGPEYTKTRHNAGFMVIDRLAERHGRGAVPRSRFQSATCEVSLAGEKCLLMKPTTYMNLSGRAVGEAVGFFKVDPASDLLVVVDDLYLPTGSVRLRPGGGSGGHNGLSDIERALGGDGYPRLRLGVGLRPGGGKPPQMDQADFVLSRFAEDEGPLLEQAVTRASQGAEAWVGQGLAAAMNMVNAPEVGGSKPPTGDGGSARGGAGPGVDDPNTPRVARS